jgi:3-isopropylmalate/(R)-2-methylmalate dehydratase large subunit
LCHDPAQVREQLAGRVLTRAQVGARYALPGELIVGTDSHTPHSDALGCVAFGVGTTDRANALMTGAVRIATPEVLRIEVDGALPPGVGRVFEFGGAGVRRLSIDERATLTNMTAELGGFTGLVEPDEETLRFRRAPRRPGSGPAAVRAGRTAGTGHRLRRQLHRRQARGL